jgi:hypothetical protein
VDIETSTNRLKVRKWTLRLRQNRLRQLEEEVGSRGGALRRQKNSRLKNRIRRSRLKRNGPRFKEQFETKTGEESGTHLSRDKYD